MDFFQTIRIGNAIVGELFRDAWYGLRQKAYRNVEPLVHLCFKTREVGNGKYNMSGDAIPGFTARECFQTHSKSEEEDKTLTRRLIAMGHDTPLQGLNYIFYVSGISKSLQAQWTRHKIGVGWSFRSTRRVKASANNFVYPTYHYMPDENVVKELLEKQSKIHETAIKLYENLLASGSTRQDARRVMPVSFATSCYFYCNARALRYFFKLRLTREAEWEIRRLAWLLLKEVYQYEPIVYEDIMMEAIENFNIPIRREE